MKIMTILSVFTLLVCICCFGPAHAEEIQLSTYYPAPYGEYQEIRARQMAIGPNYSNTATHGWVGGYAQANTFSANADLVVENSLGLGIPNPVEKLDLQGDGSVSGVLGNRIRLTNTTVGASSIIGHDATGPFTQVLNNANRWSVRNQGGTQILTVVPDAVAANQRVLIGNPPASNYNLDVTGTFRVYAAAGDAQALLETPANKLRLYSRANSFYIDRGDPLSFADDMLTITQAGSVGIGTTTPGAGYRLHVVGGPINAQDGLIIEEDTVPKPPGTEVGRIWINPNVIPNP
ncbi:MAG: hypothetical protein ABH843_05075 [Candidatus Omnitrophota bacterium]